MESREPIGILDSGIGGLTVWVQIRRLLPNESTIYFADTANCPYGTKSYPEIVALATRCVDILIARGVKMVVIACNTITAASITMLRDRYPSMLFVGMEPAIKPASKMTQSGVVGILATQATLKGELYINTLSGLGDDITIIETAGTGLVEMIERGEEDSPACEALTRHYIEPMMARGADCLVLGCTHYPILTNTINRITQGKMTIIDPAPAVASRVASLLGSHSLSNLDGSAEHEFLSSLPDPAAAIAVGQRAAEMLGQEI